MSKKNLKVTLIALAEIVNNSEDKKLNIIGIFDNVFADSFPATQLKMSLVASLSGDPGLEDDLDLKIFSPDKTERFSGKLHFRIGANGKANVIANFELFNFAVAGQYNFIFYYLDKELANYIVNVKKNP